MKDLVIEKVTEIARRIPGIQRITLFGSRARGEETAQSDYDFAVLCSSEEAKYGFMNAVDELPLMDKIDLVFITRDLMETPIYKNILREGIVLMGKFEQKLENYGHAVKRLREAVDLSLRLEELVIRDGVIQRFEFTAELAWETAREYLLLQGETDINSPKPVMRAAYRTGLVKDSAGWGELLEDRNQTSHLYDDKVADAVYKKVLTVYARLLEELFEKLTALAQNMDD